MTGAAQRVYDAVPPLLQSAMISAYALHRGWKRYGGEFQNLRLEARDAARADDAAREQTQLRHLRAILIHAERHVAYYRRLFEQTGFRADRVQHVSDLQRLPILTKSDARSHAKELVAEHSRAFWTNETSGSTGTPLTVHVSQRAYQLTTALLTLLEEEHGISKSDRRATFAGRMVQPVGDESPPFWRFNWAEHQMLCSAYHLSDRNLPAYVDALERYGPAEIIGYPSAIAVLASFVERSGRPAQLPVKAVITNSETLLDWQRAIIQRAFGVPVIDYYGTAEAVVFAGQCAAGSYHPNPLMGYAEVVDDDASPVAPGVAGRLICTTLCNTAMPLVRYEIGDLVVPLPRPCSCGRTGQAWSTVLGRVDDVVITPEGHVVGRLDHVFKGVSQIREAQIAQTGPERIVLRIVPDSGYSETVEARLVSNMRERLGTRMQIDVDLITSIARTGRGKFRGVVNEWKSAGGGEGLAHPPTPPSSVQ